MRFCLLILKIPKSVQSDNNGPKSRTGSGGSSPAPNKNKTDHPERDNPFYGAGGGTRTHTMSPPKDFESSSSTIPTHRQGDINTLKHTSLKTRRDMQEGY